jgi:hypothetical protein
VKGKKKKPKCELVEEQKEGKEKEEFYSSGHPF